MLDKLERARGRDEPRAAHAVALHLLRVVRVGANHILVELDAMLFCKRLVARLDRYCARRARRSCSCSRARERNII